MFKVNIPGQERGTSQVLFNHTPATVSHSFDDENLTATTGLVPIMVLAQNAGLPDLADDRLTVSTTGADKGANPAAKLATLIGGMAAGADSIDDMNLLRHGGMTHLFDRVYAPSTLGSFLRSFAFGHVRQLDAISSRFLANLNEHTPLLPTSEDTGQAMVFVDIDAPPALRAGRYPLRHRCSLRGEARSRVRLPRQPRTQRTVGHSLDCRFRPNYCWSAPAQRLNLVSPGC